MGGEFAGTPTGTKSQDKLKAWVEIIQNLLEKNTARSTAVGAGTAGMSPWLSLGSLSVSGIRCKWELSGME